MTRGSRSARPSAPRWSTRCTARARRDARLCRHARARDRGRRARHVARPRRTRRPSRGSSRSPAHGELRFCPAGPRDARGVRWSIEGSLAVIDATVSDGTPADPRLPGCPGPRVVGAHVPDLGRGAAVRRPWLRVHRLGCAAHVGGGSHGSLHASDSLAPLVPACGVRAARRAPGQWTIRDVAPLVPSTSAPTRRLSRASARVTLGDALSASASTASLAALSPAAAQAAAACTTRCARPRRAPQRRRPLGERRRRHERRLPTSSQATSSESPVPVAASDIPPAGRRLSSNQVLAIAERCRRCARYARNTPAPTAAPT